MKKALSISGSKPIGPYSPAILNGNMLFVSGQIPMDPQTGNIITGDIAEQTNMVMNNLLLLLKEAGMDFSNVVKASIFLSDMNDFAVVNEVYASFLAEPFPARETIQVARLPRDVGVEISVIAIAS
jgi:2-iminobutanoate/2-iminopropanoate deaminase